MHVRFACSAPVGYLKSLLQVWSCCGWTSFFVFCFFCFWLFVYLQMPPQGAPLRTLGTWHALCSVYNHMLCATHINPNQETLFPNAGALHRCEGSLREPACTSKENKKRKEKKTRRERITALWTVDQQTSVKAAPVCTLWTVCFFSRSQKRFHRYFPEHRRTKRMFLSHRSFIKRKIDYKSSIRQWRQSPVILHSGSFRHHATITVYSRCRSCLCQDDNIQAMLQLNRRDKAEPLYNLHHTVRKRTWIM